MAAPSSLEGLQRGRRAAASLNGAAGAVGRAWRTERIWGGSGCAGGAWWGGGGGRACHGGGGGTGGSVVLWELGCEKKREGSGGDAAMEREGERLCGEGWPEAGENPAGCGRRCLSALWASQGRGHPRDGRVRRQLLVCRRGPNTGS